MQTKFFLSVFLYGILACSNDVEYQDFLQQQKAYDKAILLKGDSQFEEAIRYFKEADENIENFPAAYYMAECYMYLDAPDKSLDMLHKANERGTPLSKVDKELFKTIWVNVESKYKTGLEYYKQNVDTVLKRELDSLVNVDQKIRNSGGFTSEEIEVYDSQNITRLKKICKEKGWPGRKLLGYGRLPNPSILAIHASEADNLFFLNEAMIACQNNEASWFGARSIMYNLLWRFDKSDGFNKLRHTYILSNGKIDFNASFFQLYSLASFLVDNPNLKIRLNAFFNKSNPSFNKQFQVNLEEIQNILIENGVEKDRVMVNRTLLPESKDALATYFVAINFI